MVLGNSAADSTPGFPPGSAMSSMSEMAVSPTSVTSSGHFPFAASEMSGMGVDTSVLDSAFTSDVGNSVGLQLTQDNGEGNCRDSLRSLAQIPWSFSLSDLTADLSNLGGNLLIILFRTVLMAYIFPKESKNVMFDLLYLFDCMYNGEISQSC